MTEAAYKNFVVGSIDKLAGERGPLPIVWALPAGETIASAAWSVYPSTADGDLRVCSAPYAPTAHERRTVVWLEAGRPGVAYEVRATVTTSSGRVVERLVRVAVIATEARQ